MSPAASVPVAGTDRGWFDLRPLTADIDGPFFERVRPEVVLQAVDQGRLPLVGDTDALRVGSPVARPGKVVCIGLNYRDHAEETGVKPPAEPVVFLKDPATVVGPYDTVLIPRGSTKTDWEVELGVVIGARRATSRTPRPLPTASPATWSRTTSRSGPSSSSAVASGTRARAARPSTRSGPRLVTPDEVADVQRLDLGLTVNGVQRQRAAPPR